MTDDRELMQQALEALEEARNKADWIGMSEEGWDKVMQQVDEYVTHRINPAITALRERLAQPEQEPVAWMDEFGNVFPLGAQRGPKYLNEPMKPLYTAQQPRQWQGLTDAEIAEGQRQSWVDKQAFESAAWWAEAKLREKNNG